MHKNGDVGSPVTTHAAHGLEHQHREKVFLEQIAAT
jgi:hypothetical protein